MSPNHIKLPEFDFGQKFFYKEWVMDPPPWIIEKLRPDTVTRIYAVKMQFLAKIARIELQLKETEAAMYEEIAQIVK